MLCPRWHGRGSHTTCEVIFCDLDVMGLVCWTHVEILLFPRWHGKCLDNTRWVYFVSSLAWQEFGKHLYSCILYPCWHRRCLVNTGPHCHGRVLVNTSWDTFCVLACMARVCSTHVRMHFLFSMAWEGICPHMLRYILFRRWHGRVLFYSCWNAFFVLAVNRGVLFKTCWDIICVLAGMGGVWSTQIEIHFVSSLTCGGFGQHMFRYIMFPYWHGRGLVNTCWDTFRTLVRMR